MALVAAACWPAGASGAARTLAAPSAPAAPVTGVSDGRVLASADAEVRRAGIDVARRAGARIARFPIGWSTVVANETFTRPSEAVFSLGDPAHPVYRWARIDAAVRDLAAAGLEPLAYFMAAPPWAQSAPRYAYAGGGAWAPRPADLAAFASAVARRYDGTYPDPLDASRALPRIGRFQTWNEPNLSRYLQPQWVPTGGRFVLASAAWYRRMHQAAYAAIRARQSTAQIGLAGLAPTGDLQSGGARVPPMRFLRALLCEGITAAACATPLPFDAVAIHPLSTTDPDRAANHSDDVSVADIEGKLLRVLERARRGGRLAAPDPLPLWVTELNWTSADVGGVLTGQQAAVIGRAMLRLQQAGAAIVNWQFVTDPPLDRTGGTVRHAGLTISRPGDGRGVPGAPKAFLGGFAFPTAAINVGRDRAYVWGLPPRDRSGTGTSGGATGGRVAIERRSGGRWRTVAWIAPDAGGTVRALIDAPSGATLRLRTRAATGPTIRAGLRLGRVLSSSPLPGATRAQSVGAPPATVPVASYDPRPADPDGPGAFPAIPPVLPGGAPPSPSGGQPAGVRLLGDQSGRLRVRGTPSADVLVGSSAADLLVGGAGDDLLIGLGGSDRFSPGSGRDTVVRSRVARER